MKTVVSIVEEYLLKNKYDGLYLPDECACKVGDLMPCSSDTSSCSPGYLQENDEESFTIGPNKPTNE